MLSPQDTACSARVRQREPMYVLAYIAAVITGVWGVAHAIPIRQVLSKFEPLTADNRLVLAQEWLAGAFTLRGVAVLVAAVTAVAGGTSAADRVYRITAGLLLALAALTAPTGARTRVVWFKICPVLLGICATLPILAGVL
jgi:hypothetical protein